MNRKHLKFITLGALGLVAVIYFSGGFSELGFFNDEEPEPQKGFCCVDPRSNTNPPLPVNNDVWRSLEPSGIAQGGVGPIDPPF